VGGYEYAINQAYAASNACPLRNALEMMKKKKRVQDIFPDRETKEEQGSGDQCDGRPKGEAGSGKV